MDAEVLAKVLDASLQPTAEYVADLEAGMAAASAELVAFREAAAVQREADGKVRSGVCAYFPAAKHRKVAVSPAIWLCFV